MAAYRFLWDGFNDPTVFALASRLGFKGVIGDSARDFLTAHVTRPDAEFVRKIRTDLERTWLRDYSGSLEIAQRLQAMGIGPGGAELASKEEALGYIEKCRSSKRLTGLLVEALRRFGDENRLDEGGLDPLAVMRFARLRPSLQPIDSRMPRAHQLEAWKALDSAAEHKFYDGGFSGLVVMPTGSGKTYTAVLWLATRALAKGKKVLWVAYHDELVEQAASTFYALASLAQSREELRIRLVSGSYCSASTIDPSDDVVIGSIASLARNPKRALLLTEDPDRIVVIDEAHQAAAKSYMDLLDTIRSRASQHLLGLTATPTCTHHTERPVLFRLFGGKTIYQVSMRDLIDRKILAEPIPVRVFTDLVADQAIASQDQAQYDRFGELSDAHLDRIAQNSLRNQAIVGHYLEKRESYGKTLVYAINVEHAAILAAKFRKQGIKADYVASYRPDEANRTDSEIVDDFRDSDLEVLVNVSTQTQGGDLPNAQTVFLTRPTNCELLVRQMIGRVLCGQDAGGTEKVYLVSFLDNWQTLRDWKDPLSLVPDLVPEELLPAKLSDLPRDLVREIAGRMWDRNKGLEADRFEAVPAGYYQAEWDEEEDTIERNVPVYEHQKPCFDELILQTKKLDVSLRAGLTVEIVQSEFFSDCDEPRPSNRDIWAILEMLKSGAELSYCPTEDRERVDPYRLAQEIEDRDLGEKARRRLIDERFEIPLTQAIYHTSRAYHGAVAEALYGMGHPRDSTRRIKMIPTFEARAEDALRSGPHHDLSSLFSVVRLRGAEILRLEELPGSPHLEWTKRIARKAFATASWDERALAGDGLIRVNVLLDSPELSQSTLQFLLWHEYLHLYLKVQHTPDFRKLEQKWPSLQDCEAELDRLKQRFDISYW